MKNNLMILIALASAFVSCKKTGEDIQSGKALMVTAVMAPYYGEGKTVTPQWQQTDRLELVSVETGDVFSARPAMTGSSQSVFSFAVEGVADGDRMVAFKKGEGKVQDGKICFDIPSVQDGTVNPVIACTFDYDSRKTSGLTLNLRSMASVLLAHSPQENCTITSVVLESVGGEKFAGKVSVDPHSGEYTASESKIELRLPNPDPSATEVTVPFVLAPCTMAGGYKITFHTEDGKTLEYTSMTDISFPAGSFVESGSAREDNVRKLLACGSTKVYLIEKDKVQWGGRYTDGLLWSWDCTAHQNVVAGAKTSSHIDDAKPVNNKHQMLVTCSNNGGWCMLIEPDYQSASGAQLLFWTNSCANAHSAELLPGGYVAVACSDGTDCIQLYDTHKNNSAIARYPLVSAHGVVWNEDTQRLYAIGGNSLQIYRWDASKPELILEKTVSTAAYVSALHDLTLVDANTLVMAGIRAAFYNISAGTFTQIEHFNPSALFSVKSINCNMTTGECFYTFAAEGTFEGGYYWSSHKLRYTSDLKGNEESHILVDDIDMYKVRVFNW